MAEGPVVPLQSLPNLGHDNLAEEVAPLSAALERLKLEVLVVDVTHPELQIPAVYVLVPGTHFLDHTRNTNAVFHLARTASLYAPPRRPWRPWGASTRNFPGASTCTFSKGSPWNTWGGRRRPLTISGRPWP